VQYGGTIVQSHNCSVLSALLKIPLKRQMYHPISLSNTQPPIWIVIDLPPSDTLMQVPNSFGVYSNMDQACKYHIKEASRSQKQFFPGGCATRVSFYFFDFHFIACVFVSVRAGVVGLHSIQVSSLSTTIILVVVGPVCRNGNTLCCCCVFDVSWMHCQRMRTIYHVHHMVNHARA
jgi:hypothetical protein